MAYPNHNQELTIKQMVRNRLPFLADTEANTTLLSQFTLEVMYEVESCFRIRFGTIDVPGQVPVLDGDGNPTYTNGDPILDEFGDPVLDGDGNPTFVQVPVTELGTITSEPGEYWERVGNEALYNPLQRSMIADIVAVYILMMMLSKTSGGTAAEGETPATPPMVTFLKRAKAGSVEVEYEQFDVEKGTLSVDSKSMLEYIKKDALRKGRTLGCIFDICDDCSIAFGTDITPPFMLFGGGDDCLGCGS